MPYAGLTDRHGRWNGRVSLVEEHLTDPLRWKKPRRIFVNSMSDLFHENVRDEWIDQIFAVMALASQHKFQVLTKRPERMRDYMASPETPKRVDYVRHVILAGNLASLWTPERTMAIADWPGYHITSHGRVLSDRTKAGRIDESTRHEMRPQYGEQGHARVMLQVEGRIERPLIHRLVVEHFGKRADNKQVRHLDGNPKNNAIWNLAVGDQSANWDDSKRHGTHRRYSKLNPEQVEQIRERCASGESAFSIAQDFGVSCTQIRNIVHCKQWQPEYKPEWPLQSVWLGVSVENQATADERIPLLLETPAAIRFVSYEPALGPVDFSRWLTEYDRVERRWIPGLDWTIVGGESGPKARPFDIEWARSTVRQCKAAGVSVFVKQMGANAFMVNETMETGMGHHPNCSGGSECARLCPVPVPEQGFEQEPLRFKDRAGADPSEWPEDLRMQEFPGLEVRT
jgi:protein gp37